MDTRIYKIRKFIKNKIEIYNICEIEENKYIKNKFANYNIIIHNNSNYLSEAKIKLIKNSI